MLRAGTVLPTTLTLTGDSCRLHGDRKKPDGKAIAVIRGSQKTRPVGGGGPQNPCYLVVGRVRAGMGP